MKLIVTLCRCTVLTLPLLSAYAHTIAAANSTGPVAIHVGNVAPE